MICAAFSFRVLCAVVFAILASAVVAADPVVIKKSDLQKVDGVGWIASNVILPQANESLPIVNPNDQSPGAVLLRRLAAQGRAGGFDGIFYENRDRAHSIVHPASFPQLIRLEFGEALRQQYFDYGLARGLIVPAIVIGNSSTALRHHVTGRSQTRAAMTYPSGAERAFLSYANNQLYVYPEHRDHDNQDRFPANWPYTVISQGSSGSDRPFLNALLMAAAALPQATKDVLRDQNLIAPTLQMILRRSQPGVYDRAGYLSGAAHPTAFDKTRLAPERMVALAAAIKPTEIPPMVRLNVEAEDFSNEADLADLPERLFDTPSAIARVWRSHHYTQDMIVSVEETKDPNDRDLTFEWVVLRGDPGKVRIRLLNGAGTRAYISVDWHEMRPIISEQPRLSDRVDIGVFAWNGAHDSAPAMISISFPQHHKRLYKEVGETKRLAVIDYRADPEKTYFDPLLHWFAGWRDEFEYDAAGDIAVWRRILPNETPMLIDPDPDKAPAYEMSKHKGRPYLKMLSHAAEGQD